MEKTVLELAAVIERKQITLDAAAAHVGCPSMDLSSWLRGETEPSAFFLGVLPGVAEDLSRLYSDAAERKA